MYETGQLIKASDWLQSRLVHLEIFINIDTILCFFVYLPCVHFCVLFFFCVRMFDNQIPNPYGRTHYHIQIMYNHTRVHKHLHCKHAQCLLACILCISLKRHHLCSFFASPNQDLSIMSRLTCVTTVIKTFLYLLT